MKKNYVSVEMDITTLEQLDILTNSKEPSLDKENTGMWKESW